MVQAMKRFWNNQRGVTLIELLAVVVILGIIAAIAAPSILTNFDDAKNNSDKQTTQILEDAAQRYVLDQKKASSTLTAITAYDFDATTGTGEGSMFVNYLSGFDSNGYFVSAVDPNKIFQIQVATNGKVTISTIDIPE